MEFNKSGKSKIWLITKTWKRCTSLGSLGWTKSSDFSLSIKSKSWTEGLSTRHSQGSDKRTGKRFRVVPEGCFSVYVGCERERYVIRTKYLNHPLFKILLEEAESEFGYCCEGPIVLPCDVVNFEKLLMEMDDSHEFDHHRHHGCSFAKTHGSFRLLSPKTSSLISIYPSRLLNR